MTPNAPLSEIRYWEDEYFPTGGELPLRPNPDSRFDASLMDFLDRHVPATTSTSVFEIGCSPGTWLLHYAERYGATPRGIDYSELGVQLTRSNLEAAHVDGEIVQGDFFETAPSEHDVVLSLGFIEHFADIETTIRRHSLFVRPGGRLVIGVPNYRGIHGIIQRFADGKHLEMHNIQAMYPQRIVQALSSCGMINVRHAYIAGMNPEAIACTTRRMLMPIAALRVVGAILGPDRLNCGLLSSYLVVTADRPQS